MASIDRLTTNSDETEISSLISGDTIFSIPYFQRRYKWPLEKITLLKQDISNLIDDSIDFHFLGAIIVHGRSKSPSDPAVYDVIDGQQRITTLFLYLAAIVRSFIRLGDYEEAATIFQKFLVIPRKTRLPSNLKLHPCKEDRNLFQYVINDITSNKKFMKGISFDVNHLAPAGKSTGPLKSNYLNIRKYIFEQTDSGGKDRLNEIYETILGKISVVQIIVKDPTNGPRIYDSLNSRQEPMLIGDLVKNEIFRKISDLQPMEIDTIYENHWLPFYNNFEIENKKNQFENYFFPYGLTQNANLKKSEVYNYLKNSWEKEENPEAIIRKLGTYQDSFMDIVSGSNRKRLSKIVNSKINEMSSYHPTSTYPFFMQLLNHFSNESIEEKTTLDIIKIIESFLVRRAVCGHEPTGLHAVFKRLWKDCNDNPTAELVIRAIKKHVTVVWPSDEEFGESIKDRNLDKAHITKFVLYSYNKSLGGDKPLDDPWIEHILPENPDNSWEEFFPDKQQQEYLKGLLANLIHLSEPMNRELSNKSYTIKRETYIENSNYKAARELAEKFSEWTPETIQQRSEHLAKWAISYWEH